MKDMGARADAYIAENKKLCNGLYRPKYHFASPCGWINDPNGFVYFRGEYHLFFQFAPYSSAGGLMYWGHAKSKDLVTWENLPIALSPDMPYDKSGCWSGGAIEKDGKLYVMYTGHREENGERVQTQNLAVSEDGIRFEKYARNPVITADSAPEGVKKEDFRDPFVWQKEGVYYCLVGTLNYGKPATLLYRSEDLFRWEFVNVFLSREHSGYCYECPNYAEIDDRALLLLSPVDFPREGDMFTNCNSVVYSTGHTDYAKGVFEGGAFREADGGTDFYATQIARSPRGECVMIAWMNLWNRTFVTDALKHGWSGALTLPRTLKIVGGELRQAPVAALENYLGAPVTVSDVLRGEKSYKGVAGRCVRLRVRAELSGCNTFGVKLFDDGAHGTVFSYDKRTGVVCADRRANLHPITGHERERAHDGVRRMKAEQQDGVLEWEFWLDNSGIELFTQGKAISMLTYNGGAEGIVFFTDGEAALQAELRPVETKE